MDFRKGKNLNVKKFDKLKVALLGGAQEVGINSTVVQYGDDMVLIDMGFGFPGSEMYGVDYLIPNTDYLKKNKEKIRGLLITHGHLDHIGAIPYVIEDLGFPTIYASEFSIEFIKPKLEEFELLSRTKLVKVKTKDVINLGKIKASFFGINHNVPESMGIGIHTPEGIIVHTGDYKFDDTPVNEPIAEYGKICDLGEKGVLLAMCDSTNSFKQGHSISESEVTNILDEIIKNSKGRVIAATFASLVTRIYQLITIGIKYNRKIAISGFGMRQAIEIAKNLGYINIDEKHFIDPRDAKNYDDRHLLFITTGSQGEDMAALARMARKEHRDIEVREGDTIILSSSVIPGNAVVIQTLIDDLIMLGADVIHQAMMDVHAGGHGHRDDQKLMLNMLKPRFFMPIEGPQSFLLEHAKTAKSVGIKEKNIIIPQNGFIYEFTGKNFVKVADISADPVLVSGRGIGDVGTLVLKERTQLANNGFLVLGINLDSVGNLAEPIEVISRGFVFMKENAALIDEIVRITEDAIHDKKLENRKFDSTYKQELREMISGRVGKFVRKETDRNPAIVPMLV